MNQTTDRRRLTVYTAEDGTVRLRYLGDPLHLSPSELRLLRILMEVDPAQTDGQGYASVDYVQKAMDSCVKDTPLTEEELLAIFFGPQSEVPPPKKASETVTAPVAVVIERINRKASAIGGRKLIQGKSHHGYRINPYM